MTDACPIETCAPAVGSEIEYVLVAACTNEPNVLKEAPMDATYDSFILNRYLARE